MPQTPHVEKHFTSSERIRDIVIGMSDGLTVPFALAAGLSGVVQSTGVVIIHEWMFEGRLYFVDTLTREMGARIVLADPHRAVVMGPSQLRSAEMRSPDIRAGMALLAAALCAKGTSVINNIEQIDRGYEALDERLRALGAMIERAA